MTRDRADTTIADLRRDLAIVTDERDALNRRCAAATLRIIKLEGWQREHGIEATKLQLDLEQARKENDELTRQLAATEEALDAEVEAYRLQEMELS